MKYLTLAMLLALPLALSACSGMCNKKEGMCAKKQTQSCCCQKAGSCAKK